MSNQNNILEAVANYGGLMRESMLLILPNDLRYGQRIIKKCIEEKLLEAHTDELSVKAEYTMQYPVKVKRIVDGKRQKKAPTTADRHCCSRTRKYYVLTDKGIRYLAEKGSFIDSEQMEKVIAARRLFSRKGKETTDRLFGISMAGIMCRMIGGQVMRPVYEQCGSSIKLNDYEYGFVNAKTVKAAAQNGSKAFDTAPRGHDFDRCSYSGCFMSCKRILAVCRKIGAYRKGSGCRHDGVQRSRG